jgi:hypothetical protein
MYPPTRFAATFARALVDVDSDGPAAEVLRRP